MEGVDLRYQVTCLLAAAVLVILQVPNLAFGQNMNLSGNLNINDTQLTSTTNLLLSMLVSLAESIIPLVVGSVVGHKSITYWHEKKDKMASKNKILAGYSQSFKTHIQLLDNFAHRVFKSYVAFGADKGAQAFPLDEYSNTEDKVSGFLRFPSEPGAMPSRMFHDEYDELGDKINDIAQARERLYLDLRSFRKDGAAMIEKLQNIKALLKRSEILLDKFIKSSDGEGFLDCYNRYTSLSGRIKNEAEGLELDLIQFSSDMPVRR